MVRSKSLGGALLLFHCSVWTIVIDSNSQEFLDFHCGVLESWDLETFCDKTTQVVHSWMRWCNYAFVRSSQISIFFAIGEDRALDNESISGSMVLFLSDFRIHYFPMYHAGLIMFFSGYLILKIMNNSREIANNRREEGETWIHAECQAGSRDVWSMKFTHKFWVDRSHLSEFENFKNYSHRL